MKDLERIEASIHNMSERIESICNSIHRIDTVLAVNTESLIQHMRRSETLEKELKVLEKNQNRIIGAFVAAQFLIPLLLKFIM